MFLPTNKEIYDSGINRAEELIITAIEDFSNLVVQLSMANEFSDVNDLFNDGEELSLSVGDFINTSDLNVQSIIAILNKLRDFQDILSAK
ncbi:MAG: hypothetical protein EOO90_17475 [Pedobacter sp.]|nr:MAG: hypothetical protein EOO90_17475 [Pedobacter sp.]